MNHLLNRQRKWIVLVLFLEILAIGVGVFFYFYRPEFQYYFLVMVGVFSLFALVTFFVALVHNVKMGKIKGKSEMKAAEIIGNDVAEAYNFGQVGLAVCDNDNVVIWTNEFLGSRFGNLVDCNIFTSFADLAPLVDENNPKDCVNVYAESHVYKVELLKEAKLFVFKDVTDFENLNSYHESQSPVVGYIAIDNYSDVQISMGDDTRFADMVTDVRQMISTFGNDAHCLMRRIKDDRYLFITTNENYQVLYQDKFSLVDKVHAKFPNGFTLSIGVSYGFPDYGKLAESASNALDVALSRGGDQTVIAPFSQQMIYLGGKTELAPSRNRVKIRTLSNSFLTILKNYKNVVIMGHTNADFDAIGSCLGVYQLCQYLGIPARICWEDQLVEDKVRMAVESEFNKEEKEKIFISMRGVEALIRDDTILVVCDHNNPKISMFKELVRKFDNIAVLDHHRPGQDVFDDLVFNGVDTSASSASELLTFYIRYNQNNISIDSRTATFLLAGICLDTRFFKEKATNNTYEAAAQLESYNAEGQKVTEFLKEDLEEYRQKISILNNAETPYYGVIVATSPDNDLVSNVTLSQVANEAITIRGISISFCIGRIGDHEVKISARSDGSASVEILMRKLGGGGHLAMAAASFRDIHVEDAKERLMLVLKDYLADARQKTGEDK